MVSYLGRIKTTVHIKIAMLIGTIITIRHRALSRVPHSKIITQTMSMLERYLSSHSVITRKKYETIPICENIIACIPYFSQDR